MIKYKTRDGKIIYGVEGEDFISSSTLEELYDDSMVGDNAPFSTNLLSAYYDDAVDDEERKYIENYAKMHPKFAKEIRDFRHMMNYSETDNRETADNYPYQNQEPFATNNYYNNQFESKGTNKRLIRLTEQDLHKIVKESVNKVLKEALPPLDFRGPGAWDNHKYTPLADAIKAGRMTSGPRDMGPSLDEIVRSLFGEGRGSVDFENYNGSDATVFRLNGVNRTNNYEQLAELDKIMATKRCFLESSKCTDTQLILIYVRE